MLKLNKERFDASYGAMETAMNKNVLELMQQIGRALSQDDSENKAKSDLEAACREYQRQYNELLPGVQGVLDNLKASCDIAEFLEKKVDIGGVSKRDTDFKAEKIEMSAVKTKF